MPHYIQVAINAVIIFSHDGVTINRVLIGDWIFRTLTDPLLQVTIALSLIHALYNSLQHAQNLLSLPRLHQLLSGNGFQCRGYLNSHVHGFMASLAVTYLTAGPELNCLPTAKV
jgi:hypothetical protein